MAYFLGNPVGREQAAMTGERLREWNVNFTQIVHSTLDRAVETARIIHDYLPSVEMRADEMLVEGGPLPPVPTITWWRLPQKVYGLLLFCHCYYFFHFYAISI